MLDGLINGDLRRMKSVLLYFNKRIVLLVFLVMQIEAFAQRGRAIPQDWGGGGGSYSHSGVWDALLFPLLIAVVLLVLFVLSKIQSVFKRKDEPKANKGISKLYSMQSARHISNGKRDWVEKEHNNVEVLCNTLPDSFFNIPCFTFPKGWRIIPNGLIERIKSRIIRFTNLDIDIDVDKLNKFEAIIVPHDNVEYYKRLLSNYHGIIVGDKENKVWVGPHMTYEAFNTLYDDLYWDDDGQSYIVKENNFRTYFTKELDDCFGEYAKGKKPLDCKIREQYSLVDDKFYFDLYSYIKPIKP